MKHLLDRAYAPQRHVSFKQFECRQLAEAINAAGWATFFLIVFVSLLFSRLG